MKKQKETFLKLTSGIILSVMVGFFTGFTILGINTYITNERTYTDHEIEVKCVQLQAESLHESLMKERALNYELEKKLYDCMRVSTF